MKDGLSQSDRQRRIDSVNPFSVVDNRMESLLRQAEVIAESIRYYDPEGSQKEYFDQFLTEIKKIMDNHGEVIFNGNMEPSQALLYTFLYQLHHITGLFNERWNDYASWYINDLLKISSPAPYPDNAWITFNKNSTGHVHIPKGTGFTFDEAGPENKIFYRTAESIYVTDASIVKAFSFHSEKNPDIYPAGSLHIPTALKMKDLLNDGKIKGMLFGENGNIGKKQSLGLSITSPSLLLREGKRHVTIGFDIGQTGLGGMEYKRNIVRLAWKEAGKGGLTSWKKMKVLTLFRIFGDIFYLEISTPEGWKSIDKYSIEGDKSISGNKSNRTLILKFELRDNFPETTACRMETHGRESVFPTLRVYLNRNAWLFPYYWLREFLISGITIRTRVEGINNILFYNELGKVDNALPFAPFGINTERGAWFAIGNYEMSSKNVQTVDVRIRWRQLPSDDGGLFSYYQGYKNGINNRSFKLKARYLSDYKWKETDNSRYFFLFSTMIKDKEGNPESQYKLSEESILRGVLLEDMKPLNILEKDYQYNIHSKSGFFSFVMESPEMGFGEKRYRQLFSEQMIKKALLKKKTNLLNPPVMPLVERITLSYDSLEEIDFRLHFSAGNSSVAHIYPLGERQIYPGKENKPLPFVYSLDTDANIFLGLKNIKGDEFVNLFIDFLPQKEEISAERLPRVRWYWGDGYHWEVLPDDSIRKNTTQNLLVSGGIKLYVPDIPSTGFLDENGMMWLRVGITQNETSISEINKIYTHAVKVQRDSVQLAKKLPSGFVLNVSEGNLPGIESIAQVTPFFNKQPVEDLKSKQIRVSEFISHRERAVSVRDFERMTLQAFPEVEKVKCLPNTDTKIPERGQKPCPGIVTLVIIGRRKGNFKNSCSYVSPELLLEVENYFKNRMSAFVTRIDAINPVYEPVLVRCEVDFHLGDQSRAFFRAIVRRIINQVIAPWQNKEEPPAFDHFFRLQQLYDKINAIKLVKEVKRLSVVQLFRQQAVATYEFKEYSEMGDTVVSTRPYAILIPARHHIISPEINERFGIQEMEINENFVIC
ncbi:MAG: hypothetical protein LBU57_07755 [Dysgonamonadaceae bacterium]|jgi:hypothetical protein|nr:hypothetical protein [Dysgonamonadaceae bacterium]